MEKIYYRRCESYTIGMATEPIEIDVDKLRNCVPPYEGEYHSDLLDYIQENIVDNYDEWSETNREVYGDEIDMLYLEELEKEEYFDSRDKFGNLWTEVGEPNERYGKTGGFDVFESTAE